MNYGGWKHGEPSIPEEQEAKWLAEFERIGEDALRERMKDPNDPTSPGHPRHELAVEWLAKKRAARVEAEAARENRGRAPASPNQHFFKKG